MFAGEWASNESGVVENGDFRGFTCTVAVLSTFENVRSASAVVTGKVAATNCWEATEET